MYIFFTLVVCVRGEHSAIDALVVDRENLDTAICFVFVSFLLVQRNILILLIFVGNKIIQEVAHCLLLGPFKFIVFIAVLPRALEEIKYLLLQMIQTLKQ